MSRTKFSAQPKPTKPFNEFRARKGNKSIRPPMPTVSAFDPADVNFPPSLTPAQEKRASQILDMIVSTGSAAYTDTMTVEFLIRGVLALDDVEDRLNQEGMVIDYETTKGDILQKLHPLFAVRRTLFAEMRSLLGEFGLSPMTRRGLVQIVPATEEELDEWDGLLN